MAIIFTTIKYIIKKYNIISPKGLLILKTKIYLSLLALSLLIAVITLNYYEVANPVKEVINTNTVPITESATKKVIKKNQDKFFMKGIWVTYMDLDMSDTDRSYTSFKKKFDSIVDTCKEKGFNTLIVQVRPFSDALYNSSVYPYSHILTGEQGKNPNYDGLKYMCKKVHESGMRIEAWVNPYRVKSKKVPEKLSNDNPYVMDNSIGVETDDGIYLNPASKKAQDLVVKGVEEIVANYDIDGIQFDDYFYPTDDESFDSREYSQYKKAQNNNCLSLDKWRMNNVNTLIKNVYEKVHSLKDNVQFGISPQGNVDNNKEIYADVKTWCSKDGYIDYICPQIYFSLDNPALTYEDAINDWLKIKTNKNIKIYSGLAGYKAGTDDSDSGTWSDFDDILKQEYEIAVKKNYNGIMLYSYSSLSEKSATKEIANLTMKLN